MSQKCPYSEDTSLLFAAWAAGLPCFWKAVVRLTGAGSIGVGAVRQSSCPSGRSQFARASYPAGNPRNFASRRITRTVMLVIHDEHHVSR
jgi:hypothetical protein